MVPPMPKLSSSAWAEMTRTSLFLSFISFSSRRQRAKSPRSGATYERARVAARPGRSRPLALQALFECQLISIQVLIPRMFTLDRLACRHPQGPEAHGVGQHGAELRSE